MSQKVQNINTKTPQNQPVQRGPQSKIPYALKVLEDALRKNEEELRFWKKHVRVFSWMRSRKKGLDNQTVSVVIAYKDGFGKEFLSKEFLFLTAPDFCENSLEYCKHNFMDSITNIQAEGNVGPCEDRIKQIKQVLEKLKNVESL